MCNMTTSALSLGATLAPPVSTSNKTLYAVDLAPNKKRFLIIGLNQSLILDGALINLVVNISPSTPAGTYALALSNVCATDPAGNATPVAGSDGTVAVNAGTVALLQPSGVLSAGSFLAGAVAPGELVTLFGSGIGPAVAQEPSGSVTSTVLGGTSVLFDGTAAPLLYAGSNQINAIVPYGVSGKTATQLTITAQGKTIAAVTQAVAATAPAIFTLNFTGSGAGAILNQDSSVNSPSNPAVKGTVISIFASGAGQTNPPGVDGQVAGTELPQPLLPVTVQIGGLNAKVSYAGAAPGLISGVTQVNALIPVRREFRIDHPRRSHGRRSRQPGRRHYRDPVKSQGKSPGIIFTGGLPYQRECETGTEFIRLAARAFEGMPPGPENQPSPPPTKVEWTLQAL